GSQRAYSNVLRYPGFTASRGFGRFVGSVGISPMLDRTWRNQTQDTILVTGIPVPSLLQVSSEGAMNDARIGLGYVVSPKFQVGAAIHAVTGENRTYFAR